MNAVNSDRADVVVVGGGVIGCSIAYELAVAGLDVVLLEAGELGAGSTAKAAGGVRSSFSDPVNIAMGQRGLEAYARFKERFDQDIDFRSHGYLYSISDEDSLASFQLSVALQNGCGIGSRFVDADEAGALSPLLRTDGALAHVYSPHDAQATPDAVVQGYARAARKAGARVLPGATVIGVEVEGGAVSGVRTASTTYRAPKVVCAAGAWSGLIGHMAGVELPVTPSRRVVAFTGPVFDVPRAWPLTVDFPSTLYFHPEGRGLAMGWTDPSEPDGFDISVQLQQWLERAAPDIARRAPALLEMPIRTAWAGLYENTPDHNQIIGGSCEVEGFFYATGFSGHGFLMAPATSEVVRDLVLGKEPEFDISGFAVERFARSDLRLEHNII